MSYIGNSPALKYTTFAVQHFTTSATTGYTLDNAVTNENDIRLVINNVVQQPGGSYAYTAAGTVLTLSAATTTSDTMYCVFLGKAVQTVNPGAGSVGLSQLSATGTASSSTFLRGDNAWQDPGGVALATSTNNQVVTVTGADAITGETNFIYDGTIIGGGADGANADLGVGLHIKSADSSASASSAADELVLENSGNAGITIATGTGNTGGIYFADSGSNNIARIEYAHSIDSLQFACNQGEAMRIDSSKRFLFATTSVIDSNAAFNIKELTNYPLAIKVDATGNTAQINFFNGNGNVGSVSTNASATAFNTSSDYRLKENISYDFDATTRLKQLKPARFNFKTDADTTVDGFLAHEVSTIVPEAITGNKDATETKQDVVLNANGTMIYNGVLEQDYIDGKANGNYPSDSTWIAEKEVPVYQSIDQAKLVPLLTSALQEAITKIETLEARVQTLENA